MLARRSGQRGAPVQRRKAVRYALAVRGFKQGLRGAVFLASGRRHRKSQNRDPYTGNYGSEPHGQTPLLYLTRLASNLLFEIAEFPESYGNLRRERFPGFKQRRHLAGGLSIEYEIAGGTPGLLNHAHITCKIPVDKN
jgi:hypothetical protein